MLDQEFVNKMEKKLKAEKAEVEESIGKLEGFEEPMDNPDLDERANDAEEDILQGSKLQVLKQLKNKIDAALSRIKEGTYGKDIETGQEIPKDILEDEPWAEEVPPIMKNK